VNDGPPEGRGGQDARERPLGFASQSAKAWRDLADGLRMHRVWAMLARMDIRQRYRRSILGPFWITIAMIVWIAAIGPLYSLLLGIGSREFIPYLAMGIITWGLLSGLILEGGASFVGAEQLVRAMKLPYTVHVMRVLQRNLIVFAHNLLAFVPFMLWLGIWPQWRWLWALPGVALIMLAALPAAFLLGTLSARFRDLQQMLASIVQLAFFLTPIFWKPELLGAHAWVADWNPFHLLLELVRAPVVTGAPPPLFVYERVALLLLLLYALSMPFFIRYRRRLAFWV
jgi:lipopolysaccharide transport system permease protein